MYCICPLLILPCEKDDQRDKGMQCNTGQMTGFARTELLLPAGFRWNWLSFLFIISAPSCLYTTTVSSSGSADSMALPVSSQASELFTCLRHEREGFVSSVYCWSNARATFIHKTLSAGRFL